MAVLATSQARVSSTALSSYGGATITGETISSYRLDRAGVATDHRLALDDLDDDHRASRTAYASAASTSTAAARITEQGFASAISNGPLAARKISAPRPVHFSMGCYSLSGERALVTGGAGNIGSHIVDQLVEAGVDEVVVLDNFERGRRQNLAAALAAGPVRIVEGDICDRALVSRLMRGVDVVFHLAAIRITKCADEPRLALEVLVDGTYNVVEAAAHHGVRKLVASSSASVYGLAEEFPTAETHHPYANDTLYGAAKTFNEGLLRSYHAMTGLDYVALRYFNVYGPRMDVYGLYTEVLVRWMERIADGQPPLIFGDGSQSMDFVYATDIARANILAATSDATDEAFNVASGVETTLAELARQLLSVMESPLATQFGPERGVNKVSRRLADTTLARERLGFEAEVSLEQGLRGLVEWWQAERDQPAAVAEAS